MNKSQAEKLAKTITLKELRDILNAVEDFDAPCKLNKSPGFTKMHAWRLFSNALKSYDPVRQPTLSEQMAINILREFG